MKNHKIGLRQYAAVLMLLVILVFSALFWIVGNLGGRLFKAVCDMLGFYPFYWDMGVWLVLYVFALLIVILLTAAYIGGWAEKCYQGVCAVMAHETPPKYPHALARFSDRLADLKRNAVFQEQTYKMAEQRKNDMIMYLAHDLKTPLTSVIGYLSLLEEGTDLPPETRQKYTRITLEKADRLELLIDEFFDITRFNLQNIELCKSRIDLQLFLEQTAQEFYPLFAEKNMRFSFSCPQKIVMFGDADKLGRVFDNLLKNAASYGEADSTVSVTAEQREKRVQITFTSHGEEIPPEKLERIFEKFFRLDSARSGTTGGAGLGLAIAKKIVEQHGGTLTAQSEKGTTRFVVTLPTAQ